jgi:hypothetical protein
LDDAGGVAVNSARRRIVLAVKALVTSSLAANGYASADVRGFDEEYSIPATVKAGGAVLGSIETGGEPEITLSPATWHYQLPIAIEILPPPLAADQSAVIDEIARVIGAGIAANPTLGGLADWSEPTLLYEDESPHPNAPTQRWGSFRILIDFTTSAPLGG